MKKFGVLLSLLLWSSTVFAQGTQISGSQIKDGTITNIKIAANAGIGYGKIDFTNMPATIVNAENPLTFNTPLSRVGNTISMGVIPVTLGGTNLTSVTAGRLLFGGNSSTLATSNNLSFDSGTNTFTITGSGHVTSALTVGGVLTINGKAYNWPSGYGSPGSYLRDSAGNGTLVWDALSGAFVTLQSSDPGTANVGGINLTGNAYISNNLGFGGVTTQPTSSWTGSPLASAQVWNSATSITDAAGGGTGTSLHAFAWTDSATGYVASLYNSGSGATNAGLLVKVAGSGAGARILNLNSTYAGDIFIVAADGSTSVNGSLYVGGAVSFGNPIVTPVVLFDVLTANTETANNIVVTQATAPTTPVITPVGAGGGSTWTYKVVANFPDGSHTEASAGGSTNVGNATIDGTNSNGIEWGAVPGATNYDVYRTAHATSPTSDGKIATAVFDITFTDTGIAASGSAPTTNTTGIVSAQSIKLTAGPTWTTGSGAPGNPCVTGSLYTDTAGGTGTTLYVCETTAWAAK